MLNKEDWMEIKDALTGCIEVVAVYQGKALGHGNPPHI